MYRFLGLLSFLSLFIAHQSEAQFRTVCTFEPGVGEDYVFTDDRMESCQYRLALPHVLSRSIGEERRMSPLVAVLTPTSITKIFDVSMPNPYDFPYTHVRFNVVIPRTEIVDHYGGDRDGLIWTAAMVPHRLEILRLLDRHPKEQFVVLEAKKNDLYTSVGGLPATLRIGDDIVQLEQSLILLQEHCSSTSGVSGK